MPLPELLKKVRTPYSAGDRSSAEGIKISDAELKRLSILHTKVRNQFVHFAPTLWSIELSGTKELSALIVRIIEDMLKIGWAFRHFDDSQREEFRQSLHELSQLEWPGP
ncbi:hypothetical protein QWZ10_15605 [Paracoccus cavernae]|uniref:Uncharacterized protein n=2 Tax=Paracoccus cavernae TaxID=1571207 RepID=A0ABT8DAE3_9RHOB|nr:hypothetical protein [Paracoccus cavernae]